MLKIRAMVIEDYEGVLKFWQENPELGVSSEFDTQDRVRTYLDRNQGMSTIATYNGEVIGTALCGHDGRRGSLYHVGVSKEHRGKGIASKMIERCEASLKKDGIHTGFLFTHVNNKDATRFWTRMGWVPVEGIIYHYKEF